MLRRITVLFPFLTSLLSLGGCIVSAMIGIVIANQPNQEATGWEALGQGIGKAIMLIWAICALIVGAYFLVTSILKLVNLIKYTTAITVINMLADILTVVLAIVALIASIVDDTQSISVLIIIALIITILLWSASFVFELAAIVETFVIKARKKKRLLSEAAEIASTAPISAVESEDAPENASPEEASD